MTGDKPCASQISILSEDLSLHLRCDHSDNAHIEEKIENFLGSSGFDVLNKGKIQKQHGVYLLQTDITSIDKINQIVEVRQFLRSSRLYSLSLLTPPPTSRNTELEKKIVQFVESELNCTIYQQRRGVNAITAKSLFERTVSAILSQFKQARELRQNSR
jgi:hypothetical protein